MRNTDIDIEELLTVLNKRDREKANNRKPLLTRADQYLVENINNILKDGYLDINPRPKYKDGTPAHTLSVNHVVRKYDLSKGEFPISKLRRQAWKTGIREIFTIYQHPTNVISEMRDMGVTWWDPWDIGDGTIGQRYGATVKRYDLIHNLIEDIKKDPYGRRKVVSLWQDTDLKETKGLAPCCFLTIWNVRGEYLDMCMIQRSGDMLTASGAGGINEIQYAALLMMIAKVTGYEPGVFTHFVANEQIYDRHTENAHELLRRAETLTLIQTTRRKCVPLRVADRNFDKGGSSLAIRVNNIRKDIAPGDCALIVDEEMTEIISDFAFYIMAIENKGNFYDVFLVRITTEDKNKKSSEDLLRLLKTYEEWAEAGILKTPRLVLHKEKGCEFEDIRLEDFEMVDYFPIKPQLTFELGI